MCFVLIFFFHLILLGDLISGKLQSYDGVSDSIHSLLGADNFPDFIPLFTSNNQQKVILA